jgi:Na+-transporting methylmalonyl-CoA/oxaloacetate decarboxylase gamma subunit
MRALRRFLAAGTPFVFLSLLICLLRLMTDLLDTSELAPLSVRTPQGEEKIEIPKHTSSTNPFRLLRTRQDVFKS